MQVRSSEGLGEDGLSQNGLSHCMGVVIVGVRYLCTTRSLATEAPADKDDSIPKAF